MSEKHYVLQYKRYPHSNQRDTLHRHYATYEEAESRRLQMPAPNLWRVAESYTVARYKAVKVR